MASASRDDQLLFPSVLTGPATRSRLQDLDVEEVSGFGNVDVRIGDDEAIAERVRAAGDERVPSSERSVSPSDSSPSTATLK